MDSSKESSGAMKNPTAVWYEQARPAICRIFRDCFAILGLLRRPTPDSLGLLTKHGCNPAPEMTALAVNNAQRYSRISKSDRIELARFRSSFVLRRISGAHDKQSPIQYTGGNCWRVSSPRFTRWDSKGMKSLWRRFGRAERPTFPLSPRHLLDGRQ